MTVKIDRTLTEQRLMDEKDKVQKELTELKAKEAERLESERLTQAEKALAEQEVSNRPRPSGVVGVPKQTPRKSYETMADLYSDVKARESANDPTAKSQLNSLFEKMLNETKDGVPLGVKGKISLFDNGKPISQLMNENLRKRIKIQGDMN